MWFNSTAINWAPRFAISQLDNQIGYLLFYFIFDQTKNGGWEEVQKGFGEHQLEASPCHEIRQIQLWLQTNPQGPPTGMLLTWSIQGFLVVLHVFCLYFCRVKPSLWSSPTTPHHSERVRLNTTPCWPRPACTTIRAATSSSALLVVNISESARSPSPTLETLISSRACHPKPNKWHGVCNVFGEINFVYIVTFDLNLLPQSMWSTYYDCQAFSIYFVLGKLYQLYLINCASCQLHMPMMVVYAKHFHGKGFTVNFTQS